jgi:hypothetical protein
MGKRIHPHFDRAAQGTACDEQPGHKHEQQDAEMGEQLKGLLQLPTPEDRIVEHVEQGGAQDQPDDELTQDCGLAETAAHIAGSLGGRDDDSQGKGELQQ